MLSENKELFDKVFEQLAKDDNVQEDLSEMLQQLDLSSPAAEDLASNPGSIFHLEYSCWMTEIFL